MPPTLGGHHCLPLPQGTPKQCQIYPGTSCPFSAAQSPSPANASSQDLAAPFQGPSPVCLSPRPWELLSRRPSPPRSSCSLPGKSPPLTTLAGPPRNVRPGALPRGCQGVASPAAYHRAAACCSISGGGPSPGLAAAPSPPLLPLPPPLSAPRTRALSHSLASSRGGRQ